MANPSWPARAPHQNVQDYGLELARGAVDGASIVHKFGRAVVGTSLVPVAYGGVYRTPQVGSATALRVKAGNTNDTAAGSGAREITLIGLDETGAEVTETLATAGTSASSNTSATFIRLYRFYVSKSGTYATQSAGSHSADIVIENSGGTEDWATIDGTTDFPRGQSEIAVYSVPLGKAAYIKSIAINVDSNKAANILGFQRRDILKTAAPYDAMRAFIELGGLTGPATEKPNTPWGPFPELTDIGFMGEVSNGTGEIDIDFEIELRNA